MKNISDGAGKLRFVQEHIYFVGDFPAREDNTPYVLFTMMSSFHYRAIMGALLPSSWGCDENSKAAATAGGIWMCGSSAVR